MDIRKRIRRGDIFSHLSGMNSLRVFIIKSSGSGVTNLGIVNCIRYSNVHCGSRRNLGRIQLDRSKSNSTSCQIWFVSHQIQSWTLVLQAMLQLWDVWVLEWSPQNMHLPILELSGVVCWVQKELLLVLCELRLWGPLELSCWEEKVWELYFKSDWTMDSTFLAVYLASKSFHIPIETFDGSIGRWTDLFRISAS